jgi:hypothetical protein
MLDSQVALLEQVEYKSQLSPEWEQEFITRLGLTKYRALPDAPKPEKQKVKAKR